MRDNDADRTVAEQPHSTPHGNAALNPGDEAPANTPSTGENICRVCGGTGRRDGAECPNCGGTGRVIEAISAGP